MILLKNTSQISLFLTLLLSFAFSRDAVCQTHEILLESTTPTASLQATTPPLALDPKIPLPTSTTSNEWSLKEIVPVVASLITLVGVLAGLAVSYWNLRRSLAAAGWQKANEAEIQEIDAKLNNFYGKLMLILARDHIFAQDLRDRYGAPESSKPDKGYRLLPSLFDVTWRDSLHGGEEALVRQVCTAANELDELITGNLAMIDTSIIYYFVRASTHFRILYLAYQNKLGDDVEPFKKYVYPMPFDDIVNLQVERLVERKEQLTSNFSGFNEPMLPLVIPDSDKYKLDRLPDPGSRVSRLLGLTQERS